MNQEEYREILESFSEEKSSYYFPSANKNLNEYLFKFKDGKNTIKISIWIYDIQNGIPIYDISLEIYRKRRNEGSWHPELITGAGNISSLIFAKNIALEIPYFLFSRHPDVDKLILSIAGLDRRRFEIYKRAFKKHGFRNPYSTNSRCIVKLFERKNYADL